AGLSPTSGGRAPRTPRFCPQQRAPLVREDLGAVLLRDDVADLPEPLARLAGGALGDDLASHADGVAVEDGLRVLDVVVAQVRHQRPRGFFYGADAHREREG